MNKEYVWYSPELDEMRIATREAGFVFKTKKHGEFHVCYPLSGPNAFSLWHEFYLIGEL